VTRRLQGDGYLVLAPANPLRGLPADAAYLGSVLDAVPGPVVPVGHSYGCAVITTAATGKANSRALVYVAAFAPDEGEAVVGLVG
jgi:pimeloyl-ACP methyl ester carboxylesterase